jgi:uncharacterized protein
MSTTLQPLTESRRDITLDLLRGFALAGVLFMFCVHDIGTAPAYAKTFLDDLIAWPKWILIENRMYTMLILIFGIGFYVQLEKAKQKETSLVPVFMRRIMGLLILGFLHAIFLSTRDILMFYALAGAALLLIRNASNRQLLVSTLIVFLILVTPVIQVLTGNPWQKAQALVQPNNYTEHVRYNWQYFILYHQTYSIYIDMLFHFMLGFWIGRSGILQKLKSNPKFRRSLLMVSLAGTLIMIPFYYYYVDQVLSNIIFRMSSGWQKFLSVTGFRIIWQLWMMISVTLYSTLLIGMAVTSKRKNRLRPLAAFGQMALSNYLIQSLILVPWLLAFDKFNDIPPFTGFILFLLVLTLQLSFSTWWLARYKLGPFEWLLRSFTYWSWQPIKKRERALPELEAAYYTIEK